MPGDAWQRFANLRAYYAFMFAHPGKKLMFMGCEFGQEREWNHDRSLDWHLLEQKKYAGIQSLIRDLNGLYRSLLPQSLGGSEAPLEIFMQMQEEIAKADASTAWCLGQCSVCAMTAAYLDKDAAAEIFNTPPGILAWGAIKHEVQAVPGGYRASARWDFASGSRQASWLGAHVRVVEADGTPRRKPDGSPEIRTILFPVTSATMYDVWDVIGLRGTGTDSYSVENLFIPDKFAALRDDPTALREKGPLYKLTTNMVFSMGFGATSLGLARATLDAATGLALLGFGARLATERA